MNPTLTEILQALFVAHQTIDQLRARVQELEARERAQAADADAQEIASYVSGGPSRAE